ncbi:hypothetical protein [Rhizobium sp.]
MRLRKCALPSLLLAAGLLQGAPALAGPEAPVKAIMDLAVLMWDDKAPEGSDYFDKAHLPLFSKAFIADYREAEKVPDYEEGGPFGYDVITNSQEGCPLKDVSIEPAVSGSDVNIVKVRFKPMTCYQIDTVSEIHFKVITEDGKPVISDIDRIVGGKPASLVAEMREIAEQGARESNDQQEQQQ